MKIISNRMSSHRWCIEHVINVIYIRTCSANVSQFVCGWCNKMRTSFMSFMSCLLVRKRYTEIACCLNWQRISCRACCNVCCSDCHLYWCGYCGYVLLPLNRIRGVFVHGTVVSTFTKVSLLQVPCSGFSCPGGGITVSWGASGLDTGAWCWLHLWRHRLASPRHIEGRYPAVYNHLIHRNSEFPAWTSDHRHHSKVGISTLNTNLKSVSSLVVYAFSYTV